mgnify:CR=1 FL=1
MVPCTLGIPRVSFTRIALYSAQVNYLMIESLQKYDFFFGDAVSGCIVRVVVVHV